MEKPLILSEKELNEDVVLLINKYLMELPASIIRNSFTSVIPMLDDLAQQQLQKATEEYNNFLKEQEVIEHGGQANN